MATKGLTISKTGLVTSNGTKTCFLTIRDVGVEGKGKTGVLYWFYKNVDSFEAHEADIKIIYDNGVPVSQRMIIDTTGIINVSTDFLYSGIKTKLEAEGFTVITETNA